MPIRRYLFLIICYLSVPVIYAQTEKTEAIKLEKKDSLSAQRKDILSTSSLSPAFDLYGIVPVSYGYSPWILHKGFNASAGLSLTFSPSRFSPSGVGFGQEAAFLYAIPVTNRISVAGGLYANHLNWGFMNYKQVGLTGIVGFKLTERINFYAYGNKSFIPNNPCLEYAVPTFSSDRLGGMFRFKVGENSSFSIGIEGRRNNYVW